MGRIIRIIASLIVVLIASPGLFSDLGVPQTNINAVATILENNARPDDLIVVAPWVMGITFNRYYHGQTPWITLPNIEDHLTHRYDLIKDEMINSRTIGPALKRIRDTLGQGRQVWLVGPITQLPDDRTPAALPAPPLPGWGWYSGYYTMIWESEGVQAIRGSATAAQNVALPVAQKFESVPLILVSGRRP